MGDYSAVYGLEDIRSCAPLSNGEFIDLIRKFPGVEFGGAGGWAIYSQNPVAAQPLLNLLNVKYLLAAPFFEIAEQTRGAISGMISASPTRVIFWFWKTWMHGRGPFSRTRWFPIVPPKSSSNIFWKMENSRSLP